ncbi:MAG TPA: cyanophycinase [Planctomycetaceae bacterium]|nr:cyanophycinase [Planctomycetaceae bacterium]
MLPAPSIAEDEPRGALLLIGGAQRDGNRLLWDEFVRLAGGPGASVAVFATASVNPQRTGRLYVEFFAKLGLKATLVPLSTRLGDGDVPRQARDPQSVAQVQTANAVYLAGGDQRRYRDALVADGTSTPLLDAIWHVYRKGGLVSGTSAGMAVMSRVMYADAEFNLPVMLHGATMGREADVGLGFVPPDWFVDQHFLSRGRFARTLVAMRQYEFPFGLGIEEDTCVVIERGRVARVVGHQGVTILDASAATTDPQEPRFNVRDVRLTYLSHGDSIDLMTRQVAIGPGKSEEYKIDPFAPNFEPSYLTKQFYNDIVANMMLLEVMYKLVDSPHEEATGLVFDGAAAKTQPKTPGFEFTFRRNRETIAWESPTAPGEAHTVLNVFLDIRPITIRGPLYE